jgi:crotonyl-CoA carboxylase/reductase
MSIESVPIGEMPPIGEVPRYMRAQVIRRERYGEPSAAFRDELITVPSLGPRDVLVYIKAAGVNYSNVWAALGSPVDVVEIHNRDGDPSDFHIGGSEGSGIVYAVGPEVTSVRVGDQVVVHPGVWDVTDPFIRAGGDPMLSSTNRAYGFETNWGTFAQFARVKEHQCLPKPEHLSWEEAAAYILVAGTAYRMLYGWSGNEVAPGDVVLVWGGSGGVGTQAIQMAAMSGGIPVAVVSSDERGEYCMKLGARGYINRMRFRHWGPVPAWDDREASAAWLSEVKAFGRAVWEAAGMKKSPRIVVEHTGQDTLPTSIFLCDRGGMVVTCGATTGYLGTMDLRFHWMRQIRFQGSHIANYEQFRAANDLVRERKLDPCLSRVFAYEETAEAHQIMRDNRHPPGNMVVQVGSKG